MLPAKDDLRGIKEVARRCADKATLREELGDLLGCGEQGCAYSVVGNSNVVIKVTPLESRSAIESWLQEAHVGCTLGILGIAPRIYRSFECSGYGFIVMERLVDASRMPGPGGALIREYDDCDKKNKNWKSDCFKRDHISLMPPKIQKEFIDVFAKAIENGFLHMDNHIENIGFLLPSLKPCLFDFGFTQKRTLRGPDASMALAFSIGQILEHCPVEEMRITLFFATFCELIGIPNSVDALRTAYPMPRTKALLSSTLSSIKRKYFAQANADLYVGTECYAYVLGVPLEKRLTTMSSIFIDEIYDIRQNKYSRI